MSIKMLRSLKFTFFIVVLFISFMVGCKNSNKVQNTPSTNENVEQFNKSPREIEIENMPLNQKLGQLMCLDFRFWNGEPVTELSDEIKDIISKYHIGCVLLFSENFKTKEQSKKLVSSFKQVAQDASDPSMLICVDQEGGTVERFSFNRARLENNTSIGKKANPEAAAFKKGEIIASELAELGINCDLAPVVDINSNPNNSIIGVRSFGTTPEIVSLCGVSFMEALHFKNILATAKHFPGHGDTDTDSHVELPIVNKTIQELENMELKPFKQMINSGVDLIMAAHIQVPALEPSTITSKKDGKQIFIPATLSKKILTGLLRDSLKYQGVIITDGMDMKAITDNIGEIDAIKMAISAGANILCMPVILREKSDIQKLDNIFEALTDAVQTDEISINQINNSMKYILVLKDKLK